MSFRFLMRQKPQNDYVTIFCTIRIKNTEIAKIHLKFNYTIQAKQFIVHFILKNNFNILHGMQVGL